MIEIIYRDYRFYEFPNMDAWDAKQATHERVFEEFGEDADYKIDRIDEWEEDGENGTDIDVTVVVDKIYDVDSDDDALAMFESEFPDYDSSQLDIIRY